MQRVESAYTYVFTLVFEVRSGLGWSGNIVVASARTSNFKVGCVEKQWAHAAVI
jgi:hypothetical protein